MQPRAKTRYIFSGGGRRENVIALVNIQFCNERCLERKATSIWSKMMKNPAPQSMLLDMTWDTNERGEKKGPF